MNKIVVKCIKCESEFTEEQIKGFNCCPNCKTKSLPLDPEDDINIKINLHELRILAIWAENYAISVDNKNLDNAYHESLKDTVSYINKRIHKQLKLINKDMSLTLSEEFQEIKDAKEKGEIQCGEIEFFRDGKEEI